MTEYYEELELSKLNKVQSDPPYGRSIIKMNGFYAKTVFSYKHLCLLNSVVFSDKDIKCGNKLYSNVKSFVKTYLYGCCPVL